MFRKNIAHQQPYLISNIRELPQKQQDILEKSWAGVFRREVFNRIDEDVFAPLYADIPSRPNAPVNELVALEFLKAGNNWTDQEMYEAYLFNQQTRYALGIEQFGEVHFEPRTIYNFRARLSQYMQACGVNLLEQAFERITDEQLEAFALRTGKQRMDSVLLASNIRQTGRLQLLVEVLQRVHRMLNPGHQTQYAETFAPYIKEHAGHYLYRLKREDYAIHMQQIGETMQRLLDELRSCYEQETAYQLLTRVFAEHFKLTSETVTPKPAEELSASSLQSPDDWEATYRTKRGKGYQGYVANLSETCDSENPFQLITKVQTAPNLTDDSQLLVEALPNLCERTHLETLYTDGGYGSPQADTHLQEYHIELVQTAIRGRKPDPEKLHLQDFDIELTPADDQTYQVTCPAAQTVAVQPTPQAKSLVARFDPQICTVCPLLHQCPAQPAKRDPSHKLRFTQAEALAAQRHRRHQSDRRCAGNQRAAIEATIRSVKHPFPAGKLPVRGLFRVACMVIGSAALSNLRRISNYLKNQKLAKVTRKNIQKHLNCDQNASLKSFFLSLYNRFYRLVTNPGSSISFFPC